MTVIVTQDILKNVLKAIEKMGQDRVLIGVPDNSDGRRYDTIGNAGLAAVHEFGSGAQNIPARPFLRPGVQAVAAQAAGVLQKAAVAGFTDHTAIDRGLNSVGLLAQTSVKRWIVSQEGMTPLKAATIAARKRKGFSGESALIRTGQLLNSITYVLRKKNGTD